MSAAIFAATTGPDGRNTTTERGRELRIGRKIRRWIAAGTIAIILFTLYAIRPTPIIGVDGDSLSHSVIGGGLLSTSCTHHREGTWTAILIGGFGRKHLSGCITLIDHVGFL